MGGRLAYGEPALRMPRVRRDYPAGERTEEPPEGM
jgi:hypothetical protein